MNIKEAIDKALPEGRAITREYWESDSFCVLPTNSTARMILHDPTYEVQFRALCCWEPQAEDLQAVDWKVVEPVDKSISGVERLVN